MEELEEQRRHSLPTVIEIARGLVSWEKLSWIVAILIKETLQ